METAAKVTRTDRFIAPLGERGLEIVGYEVHLPQGYEIQAHRHAYATVARVLDGVLRWQVGDAAPMEYNVGEVFSEPAGVPVRGTALKATTLYVVLVREPGVPESRPA